MPIKSRKQVSFIDEAADTEPIVSLKQPGQPRKNRSRNTAKGSWLSRDSRFYSVSFLIKRVGVEVVKALSCDCVRRKPSGIHSSDTLARSISVAETMDSHRHRAEAIEDCIEFLYSSSSMHRSNSVSLTTCSKLDIVMKG